MVSVELKLRMVVADESFPEMFGKVDAKLGEDLKKTTEAKLEGNHAHPHKTAWH